jgi:signal transduction histidine kinase
MVSTQIEAGKVDLEWVDFDLIGELESLVDMFSVQCNQKGIEIVLDLAENMQRMVKGDQARIRQIFANLLSNAIKFSSEGGQIVVRSVALSSSIMCVLLFLSVFGIATLECPCLRNCRVIHWLFKVDERSVEGGRMNLRSVARWFFCLLGLCLFFRFPSFQYCSVHAIENFR